MSEQKINDLTTLGNDMVTQILLMKAKFNENHVQNENLGILYNNYKNLFVEFRSILYRISVKFNDLYNKRARIKQ